MIEMRSQSSECNCLFGSNEFSFA